MRRLVIAFTLAGAFVAAGAAPALATPPLPIVGGGGHDNICLVWYGADQKAVNSPGDICVTY